MAIFNRFPYSNFHGMNLDWILQQVKNAVNESNRANLTADETRKYVNEYFDNLNVENEVREQLDKMREDGTLERIIGEYLSNIVYKKNIILIGDSFAGGVVGANLPNAKGWIQFCIEQYSHLANFYQLTESLSGVFGFASSRPFLDVLKSIENRALPNDVIIDEIVVLGGTNDIGIDNATIQDAVKNFVTYCKSRHPLATVKIGVLSTLIAQTNATIVPNYSICRTVGAEFITDTTNLLCLGQYIAADTVHLTPEGYNNYNPYIAQAVMFGSTSYEQRATVPVTYSAPFVNGVSSPILDVRVTNNAIQIALRSDDSNTNSGFFDHANVSPGRYQLQVGTFDADIIRIPTRTPQIIAVGVGIVFEETLPDYLMRPFTISIIPNRGLLYMNLSQSPSAENIAMRFYITGENYTFPTR